MPDINTVLAYGATALLSQGPLFVLLFNMRSEVTRLRVQMDLLMQDRHASLKQRS